MKAPSLTVEAAFRLKAATQLLALPAYAIDFSTIQTSTMKLTSSATLGDVTLSVAQCTDAYAGMTITIINNLFNSTDRVLLPQSACSNTFSSGTSLVASQYEYLSITCMGSTSSSALGFCSKLYDSAQSNVNRVASGVYPPNVYSINMTCSSESGVLTIGVCSGCTWPAEWAYTIVLLNSQITAHTLGVLGTVMQSPTGVSGVSKFIFHDQSIDTVNQTASITLHNVGSPVTNGFLKIGFKLI